MLVSIAVLPFAIPRRDPLASSNACSSSHSARVTDALGTVDRVSLAHDPTI